MNTRLLVVTVSFPVSQDENLKSHPIKFLHNIFQIYSFIISVEKIDQFFDKFLI